MELTIDSYRVVDTVLDSLEYAGYPFTKYKLEMHNALISNIEKMTTEEVELIIAKHISFGLVDKIAEVAD